MSRYSAALSNGRSIAWGFDRQLQEYFLQEHLSDEELNALPKEELNVTDAIRFSISSHTTLTPHPDFPEKMDWDNSEILELMEGYKPHIPEQHKLALALDLPF